ncbi:MAG: RnfABCDGE type electron transport complex subunit D [Alkalispirochaeta sp.]
MNLSMEPAPHLRTRRTDATIMRDVLVALLFPTVAAVYLFGSRVLVMCAAGVVSAVAFEAGYQKIAGKTITVSDYSAAVTGLLVALSLPTTAPLWSIVLGTAFAIIVVKQLPGGLGRNAFNPAVAARVMLKVFFEPQITQWVTPGPDAVATATPLEYIGHFTRTVSSELPPLSDLFWGFVGGGIGETSKFFIVLGLTYLVVRRIIDLRVPLATVSGTAITVFLYSGFNFTFTAYHVLSGTLIFAAVYMVTDYSSGPLTIQARIVYAFLIGVVIAGLRILFQLPGGVGIAILIMNLFSGLLDRFATPRVIGHARRKPVKSFRQPT